MIGLKSVYHVLTLAQRRANRNLTKREREVVPEAEIWHSDQGKQYGAQKTIETTTSKGLTPSMSRAGTPTDNSFVERFMSTFKHAIVKRRPYYSLGDFLLATKDWINFYNQHRPHEDIKNLSPNDCAHKFDWSVVPTINRLTVE